jgi:peptidoglycan/xylan/chitin deacetylase (PgdA/CDA1 family)
MLSTYTATHGDNIRRWRPAPAIRFSILLHAAGVIFLAVEPDAWRWIAALLIGNQLALSIAVLFPRGRVLGPNLVRLPAAAARRREVCLTFDDGPTAEVTPPVLDLLDRFRAKATFFCIGENAVAHPELIREIVRRGHCVENHSYHHRLTFAFFGLSRLGHEVDAAQAAIAAISGRSPQFFRAPAGFRSPLLDPILATRGLRYVSWTRRGFDTIRGNPGRVLRRLVRGLAAGDVLLLHDSGPVVLDVLPELLEEVAARGLNPVSLSAACADSSEH